MQNNFRVVLAKKKLKMSDVIHGTGLSKNTIRALYYETAKGVQFDTLEALCTFLQCEVGDLLEVNHNAAI